MIFVDRLVAEDLHEIITLYGNIEHNTGLQFASGDFRRRCEASIGNETYELHVSDNFGARDITVRPRVFTFKIKFKGHDNETIVGCATAFRATRNIFGAEEVAIIDLCFLENMNNNRINFEELSVISVKKLVSKLLKDFNPQKYIGVYFYANNENVNITEEILRKCRFKEIFEPGDNLVFVEIPLQPPHGNLLREQEQQITRAIAAWVLNVQHDVDPVEREIRPL